MIDSGRVRALLWDDWNLGHISKHGMGPEDAAEVLRSQPVIYATYKDRLRLIGPNAAGRVLTVIVGPVPDQSGVFYVFSARPASRKERWLYVRRQGDPV